MERLSLSGSFISWLALACTRDLKIVVEDKDSCPGLDRGKQMVGGAMKPRLSKELRFLEAATLEEIEREMVLAAIEIDPDQKSG